jgi:hypothetical protein
MAGDDDRPGVAAERLADRLRPAGIAEPRGERAIGRGFARRDRPRLLIDGAIEALTVRQSSARSPKSSFAPLSAAAIRAIAAAIAGGGGPLWASGNRR